MTPLQRALALLTRREHSRRELARKLVERGVEAAEAEAVVERLAGEGWQDDRRYAELVVRSRVSGGYGPRRIRAELSQQGLEADLISEAMDGFDGDWTETACDLVRRRFGPAGLQSLAQRRKAADLLFRRGFEGDAIQRATRLGAED
ncbi:recombinase RecX [Pseudoxanthomonas dokdonensis]|uniref:Regulatory protein RecX n=1 Tax=Pseudoxanthomonas dokdonensis TaxID=344882 RepID=A0A0R0CSD8_9GAMM|nr:recombinase RecX [Pseudoxanthomonas dokdonensis]